MTLEEYMAAVAGSKPTDWAVSRTPTFLFRLVPVRNSENRVVDFEVKEHNFLLTFKKDIRMALAFGLVDQANYTEDWVNVFPNKRAQVTLLDFLYNGQMVFREQMVGVDGNRCVLPKPANPDEGPPFEMPERRLRIAKLVHTLTGPQTKFDAYFQRASMQPAKKDWPV